MSANVLQALARRTRRLARLCAKGQLNHPALARARMSAYLLGEGKAGYSDPRAVLDKDGIDTARMSARFCISTTSEDRDGDIVEARGCKLENYTRNPVVLFGHQRGSYAPLPIGLSRDPEGKLTVSVGEKRILATCYFHGKTAESNQIFELVKEGVLQATSIGFLPHKAEFLDKEEDSLRPYGWRFLEWDLLEWSIVNVPSNPEAISLALSKGRLAGDAIGENLRGWLEPMMAPGAVWVPGWTGAKADPEEDDEEPDSELEEDEDEDGDEGYAENDPEENEDDDEEQRDDEGEEDREDGDEEDKPCHREDGDEEDKPCPCEDEDEDEEERSAPVPYGARMIGTALAWLRGCKAALEAGLPRMERPFAVTDELEAFVADLGESIADLQSAGRRHYPGLDFRKCAAGSEIKPIRPVIGSRKRQPEDAAQEVLSLLQEAGKRQDQIDHQFYQLTGRRP